MNAKIAQLPKLQTFRKTTLPEGRKAVTCKWVFHIKQDEDRNITKYKARLVARGFSQIPGIDYLDTYSPVVRQDSLRAIIAIVAEHDMELETMDIVGA